MIIHVSHACVKPKTVIEIIEITHKTSEQNYNGPDTTTKPKKAAKATVNAIKDVLEDYNTNTVC